MRLPDIIDAITGLFQKPDRTESALDVDRDGNRLFREDIISNILTELERRRSQRSALEKQWVLNANFLVGNQYCDVRPYSGDIEQLARLHHIGMGSPKHPAGSAAHQHDFRIIMAVRSYREKGSVGGRVNMKALKCLAERGIQSLFAQWIRPP